MELALIVSIMFNVVLAFYVISVSRMNDRLIEANLDYLLDSSTPEVRAAAERLQRRYRSN